MDFTLTETLVEEDEDIELEFPELPSNRRGQTFALSSIEVPEEYYHPISTGNALLDSVFSRCVVRVDDHPSLLDNQHPDKEPSEESSGNEIQVDDGGIEYRRGIIPGSVTLFTGEAGTGKTTLMIFLASLLAERRYAGKPIQPLFVTLEMDLVQLKFMADRFKPNDFEVTPAGSIAEIKENIFTSDHRVIIIDSLQLIKSDDGGDFNRKEQLQICRDLILAAKQAKVALFIVGHVNKDGKFAGSNSLKHMVDSHLHFFFDPDQGLRILQMEKNRFGVTGHDSRLVVKIGAAEIALIHPSNIQEIDNATVNIKSAKAEKFDYDHADVNRIFNYSNTKMYIVAVGTMTYKARTMKGTKEYHPKKKSVVLTGEIFLNGEIVSVDSTAIPTHSKISASSSEGT